MACRRPDAPARMPDPAMTANHRVGWAVVLVALGVAAALRLPRLDERPLHADEAVNTMILYRSMGADGYRFNPTHYHGPIQPILARVIARAEGWSEYIEYRIGPLRAIPVAAGMLSVLLLFAFRPVLGRGACFAALGAAVSPLLVYYSRMWIHETLLGFSALSALIALWRGAESRSRGRRYAWAIIAGMAVGLMLATKATACITFAAWTLAFVLVWGVPAKNDIRRLGVPALAAGALALALAAALYTDFLRYPAAAMEAVRSLFIYEKGAGHEYPFFHHIWLIFAPKFRAGYVWGETALGLLALVGVARAWIGAKQAPAQAFQAIGVGEPDEEQQRFARFLAWATLFHWLAYSLIAYKTPWLMIVPLLHVILLTGYGAAWLFEKPARRWVNIFIAVVLIAMWVNMALQCYRACFRYAADGRNPYAYSPTSTDVEELEKLLIAVADANPELRDEPVAVVGREFWPLPWYLRTFPRAGYWPEMDHGVKGLPIVLALPWESERVEAMLGDGYFSVWRGLRHEVPVTVFIRHDAWQGFQRSLE